MLDVQGSLIQQTHFQFDEEILLVIFQCVISVWSLLTLVHDRGNEERLLMALLITRLLKNSRHPYDHVQYVLNRFCICVQMA